MLSTHASLYHYTTLPDRHEMTTLSGSPDVKGVAITTTTNRAYELIKHGGGLEDEYDLVSPPESPPGDMSMWFHHHPLPPLINLSHPHLWPYPLQGMELEQEKRQCMSPFLGTSNPLQYMDWCDVVTVGCLDFPSLDTSTYNTHYIVVMCVV